MGKIVDQYERPITGQKKPNPIMSFIYFLGLWESKSEQASSKNEPTRSVDDRRFEMEIVADRLARTGAIIGITVAVIYFVQMQANLRQAQAAEHQLDEMHRQLVIGAEAARQQLVEMQTQRILGERAWVLVSNVEKQDADWPSNYVVFKVTFKNFGKTPAIDAAGWAKWTENLTDVPTNFTFQYSKPDRTMIAPDSIVYTKTEFPIWDVTLNPTNVGGPHPFFVYGSVRYQDIFRTNHWTTFCYKIEAGGKIWLGVGGYNTCDDAGQKP
jgi:hypothetical protein